MAIAAGQREVVKHSLVAVAAGPASTTACENNPNRVELILQNLGAASMWIKFATTVDGTLDAASGPVNVIATPVVPTAVANEGIELGTKATFVTKSYTGPVAFIGTAGQNLSVTEL